MGHYELVRYPAFYLKSLKTGRLIKSQRPCQFVTCLGTTQDWNLNNRAVEQERENLPIAPGNENPFPASSNAC